MNKLFLITVLSLVACNVGNSKKSSNVADSNNDNSVQIIGDKERACDLCETEKGLERMGYDKEVVESYINCTDFCGLPANGDPVKVQCDRDCIADRLELATEDCKAEYECLTIKDEDE